MTITDPIPTEAVEAAATALLNAGLGTADAGWYGAMAVEAAAPHIAAQERTTAGAMTELFKAEHEKNRDLRAGIEALRDEWHKGVQGRFENGRHPGTLGSCAAALDALIGGAS